MSNLFRLTDNGNGSSLTHRNWAEAPLIERSGIDCGRHTTGLVTMRRSGLGNHI